MSETPAPPHRFRKAGLVLLAVLAAAGALTVAVLRGMDGPLVMENFTGATTGPGKLGELRSVSYVIAMPEGAPATIKAVRTTVDPGLEVVDAFVSRRGSMTVWAGASEWPRTGKDAPPRSAFKQPGAFKMSTRQAAPASDTIITVVLRPRREGAARVRSIEVDYTRGLRRHRKRFTDRGPTICVNPRDTREATVDFCRSGGA